MIHYLRQLPVIEEFKRDTRFLEMMGRYDMTEATLLALIEEELAVHRKQILEGTCTISIPSKHAFLDEIFLQVEKVALGNVHYSLKRVINGTGIVLDESLGRARLSQEAIRHITEVTANYTNVGCEGAHKIERPRDVTVEKVIQQVTGAEAAMVVNNNAAAMYIILRTFTKDKEVLVSRGNLIELDNCLRVEEIVKESGAILKEVGSINRTYVEDYERLLNESTTLLMNIHASNIQIDGFTHLPDRQSLINFCLQHRCIYYENMGSGALIDYHMYGIGNEPIVKEVVSLGAGIVSFSGDKLLGGPQAGIIVGEKRYIDELRMHPLARALRVDKMRLAALEATLLAYTKGTEEMMQIPTVHAILEEKEAIKDRAERFMYTLVGESTEYDVEIQEAVSDIGGNIIAKVEIPTYVAVVSHRWKSNQELATFLSTRELSIIARTEYSNLVFDFRTIMEDEVDLVIDALLEGEEI
ncbi:L-seryl-tRNA(Sec) selenium transferase [Priestia taiwanensis]|uniref:L-seryl-tRNA(Sec) selenium transferase n=1 Tax=Priestia taiwanensis TaxID=1347902 RepID=A0A917AXE0_9BACI|nr:L-seryl-tRNA(Sec) selenium transferase [Priestia taiwanensis]MBM7364921.1 L-seryl-tRNA(Ser) seleniumtransferase [Priestia taiwanensis]GGE82548.1 L-seryl-tRNA(Sec) selenium transferase [Priestia taiwanensis]